MARTTNSEDMKRDFSLRLNEEFDRIGWDRQGRGVKLAKELGMSHTTTSAWLRGAVPALETLIDLCKKYDLDFTYVCTGERSGGEQVPIDSDKFRRAVQFVNDYVMKNGWFDDVGLDRLGQLYMRAYLALACGKGMETVQEDIRFAAGH